MQTAASQIVGKIYLFKANTFHQLDRKALGFPGA